MNVGEGTVEWEALRKSPAEVVAQVEQGKGIVGVHTSGEYAHYELLPASLADPSALEACVKISPDQFRRHSAHMRSALRCSEVIFGFRIDGTVKALLRRHKDYKPLAARFIAEFAANRAHAEETDLNRLEAIEGRLAKLDARVGKLEKRART